MKSSHVHLWGVKGRLPHRPRPGDLCLTCPLAWTPRAGGWHTPDYRPRTQPHHITRSEGAA